MSTMLTHSVWISLVALACACTGRGIDRSDAMPLRATLEIRPVADGDPFEQVLADTAQGARPLPPHVSPYAPLDVFVEEGQQTSPALPPVPVFHIRAGSKETLEQLVRQSEPAPSGRAVAYEPRSDGQWALMVVDTTEGFVLGPQTGLKLAPGDPGSGHHGVYLLMSPEDGVAFERLTRKYEWRRLAILDRDEVLLAPTVQEPVSGGEVLLHPGTDGTPQAMLERLAGPAPR